MIKRNVKSGRKHSGLNSTDLRIARGTSAVWEARILWEIRGSPVLKPSQKVAKPVEPGRDGRRRQLRNKPVDNLPSIKQATPKWLVLVNIRVLRNYQPLTRKQVSENEVTRKTRGPTAESPQDTKKEAC